MIEDADDLSIFFDTDDFAEAVTYTANAGSPVTVVGVFDQPRDIGGLGSIGAMQSDYGVKVRASEVATPAKGDIWTIRGATYAHGHATLDDTGKIWTIKLNRQ